MWLPWVNPTVATTMKRAGFRITMVIIIIIIIITRPRPAFGRLGLGGSLGGYTYHGYTSHASPCACGARLGQIVQELVEI